MTCCEKREQEVLLLCDENQITRQEAEWLIQQHRKQHDLKQTSQTTDSGKRIFPRFHG